MSIASRPDPQGWMGYESPADTCFNLSVRAFGYRLAGVEASIGLVLWFRVCPRVWSTPDCDLVRIRQSSVYLSARTTFWLTTLPKYISGCNDACQPSTVVQPSFECIQQSSYGHHLAFVKLTSTLRCTS